MKKEDTSWESSDQWYDSIVGKAGHHYHQKVIIPNTLRLLDFPSIEHPSLLDLACGQGVLGRALPKEIAYHGIDLSPSLIQTAKKLTQKPNCTFSVGDICKDLKIKDKQFTHASILLALQNVASPERTLQLISAHLLPLGTLVIILNHPCFRIPRQSHWGIDEAHKLQYRRIDRYLSPLKIPIQTHPGKGKASANTWTFHHPLSSYSHWLYEAGFSITLLEEWSSDKKSTGKRAKMENRAREEFPLFLAIKAQKL